MITQEQLDEAILGELGRPDWAYISAYLVNQALVARDACADATSWEQVQQLRGFAEGLAFVVNLRENTQKVKEQEATNAAL